MFSPFSLFVSAFEWLPFHSISIDSFIQGKLDLLSIIKCVNYFSSKLYSGILTLHPGGFIICVGVVGACGITVLCNVMRVYFFLQACRSVWHFSPIVFWTGIFLETTSCVGWSWCLMRLFSVKSNSGGELLKCWFSLWIVILMGEKIRHRSLPLEADLCWNSGGQRYITGAWPPCCPRWARVSPRW